MEMISESSVDTLFITVHDNGLVYDYSIATQFIPKSSLLYTMLNSGIGIDKDEFGYIVLDGITNKAFNSYASYLNFDTTFIFDQEVIDGFDYMGHSNEFNYPWDYWKVKLINDHDKEFKDMVDISSLFYIRAVYLSVYYGVSIDRIKPGTYTQMYSNATGNVWFEPDKYSKDYVLELVRMDGIRLRLPNFNYLDLRMDIIQDINDSNLDMLEMLSSYTDEISYYYPIMREYFNTNPDELVNLWDHGVNHIYEDIDNKILYVDLLDDYLSRTTGPIRDRLEQYYDGDNYIVRKKNILLLNDNIQFSLYLDMNVSDQDNNILISSILDKLASVNERLRKRIINKYESFNLHDNLMTLIFLKAYTNIPMNVITNRITINEDNEDYEDLKHMYISSGLVNY